MSRQKVEKRRVRWGAFGAIVTGVALFWVAAMGGVKWGGLVIRMETGGTQILVSALGIGLLAAGVLLLADDRRAARELPVHKVRDDERTYGIKVLRPARFHRRMAVEGWYAVPPPEDTLRLFTLHEDGRFRPQTIADIDVGERHWRGEVDLGPGPYYSVFVVVALVEGAGAALWDYYFQVGSQTDWEPVAEGFEACVVECDRFLVTGTIYE